MMSEVLSGTRSMDSLSTPNSFVRAWRGAVLPLSLALAFLAWAAPIPCRAQAGPPMITNDPGTPGPGRWEVNIAATGSRAASGWAIAAPDIDLNYGVGERIQLSAHMPWNHQRDDAGTWLSGAGPVELAVRWRFLEQAQAGVSMAVQPRWVSSWSQAAIDRGLAPASDEFALPLQLAREYPWGGVGVELSRNFIEREPDEWQLGAYVARDCAHGIECLAELNATRTDGGGTATIFNLGVRHDLGPNLKLMASAGRQLDGAEDRQQFLFYLGLQLLR